MCLAAGPHARGNGANRQRFFSEAGAIVHEPLQINYRNPCSVVTQPPAKAFRRALEQHQNASKSRYQEQTLNGGLDMSNSHRDMPPVKDMLQLAVATHSISDEVWERELAIRNQRQQTDWCCVILRCSVPAFDELD